MASSYQEAVSSVRRLVGYKETTRDCVYSFLLPRVLYAGVPPCVMTPRTLSRLAWAAELAHEQVYGDGEDVSSSAIAERLVSRQARAINAREKLSKRRRPEAERRQLQRRSGAPLPVSTRTLSHASRRADRPAHRRVYLSVRSPGTTSSPGAAPLSRELRLERPRPDAPAPVLYSTEEGGQPQAEAANAAASSGEHSGTCVLDLPTGFGKTRVAVATLRAWAATAGAATTTTSAIVVVICPKAMLGDWNRILKEHGPPNVRFVVLSLEKLRGGGGGGDGGVSDNDNKRKRTSSSSPPPPVKRVCPSRVLPPSQKSGPGGGGGGGKEDGDDVGTTEEVNNDSNEDLEQWGELANRILTRANNNNNNNNGNDGHGRARGASSSSDVVPSYRPHPAFLQTVREQGGGNLWIVVDEAHMLATNAKTHATRKYAAVRALTNGEEDGLSVRTLLLSGSLLPPPLPPMASLTERRRRTAETEATARIMLNIAGAGARARSRSRRLCVWHASNDDNNDNIVEQLEAMCCTRLVPPAARALIDKGHEEGSANAHGRRRHDFKATYAAVAGGGPVEAAVRLGRALLLPAASRREEPAPPEPGVKLLVFHRWIEGQNAIRDLLAAELAPFGRRCALVNSQTSDADTSAAFEAFRAADSGCDALVIGFGNAQGVDLDAASPSHTGVCIVTDAHDDKVRTQSAGRVMRMRTPNDAFAYFLFGSDARTRECKDGAECSEVGFVDIVRGRRAAHDVLAERAAARAAAEEAERVGRAARAEQAIRDFAKVLHASRT